MAEQPAPFGGRVVGGVDALLDVAPGFGQHLAHLAGHRVGDGFFALDQEIADAAEHVAPARRGRSRQSANPRLAERTAASMSRGSESGNRPIRSVGLGRVAVVEVGLGRGPTHSPPMKFLKVLACGR